MEQKLSAASGSPGFSCRKGLLFSVVVVHHHALYRARFIQDALKQAANRGVGQRPGIRVRYAVENLFLAVRLVERFAWLA